MTALENPKIEIQWVGHSEGLSDVLYLDETGLQLLLPSPQNPLSLNFLEPSYQRSLKDPPGKTSLLGKAVGFNKGFSTLIDATAGFGSDLWLFHAMGFRAAGIERRAEPFLLLQSALFNYHQSSEQPAFKLVFGEAAAQLAELQDQYRAEVIYFDFLFSQAKKGRSRKSMEVLHRLTEADSLDRELELIQLSLNLHPRPQRVTIKRPLRWKGPKSYSPRHIYEGNGIRYDIF